jgi:hypothetical protein
MSTFLDKKNFTHVVLAGDDLWHVPPEKAVRSGNTAQRLAAHTMLKGLKELRVTQQGDHLVAWCLNAASILVYQQFKIDLAIVGEPIPLRPNQASLDYEPILRDVAGDGTPLSSLVVVDDKLGLAIMEQTSERGIWNTRPLPVRGTNHLIQVNAFVSHVEIKNEHDEPAILSPCLLSGVGATFNVLVNGQEYVLSPTRKTSVRTDARGVLTIIQPVSDISGHTYTLESASEATVSPTDVKFDAMNIDPTVKIQDKMAELADVSKLEDLGVKGSKADLEEAAQAFKKLHEARRKLSCSPLSINLAVIGSSSMVTKPHTLWEFVKQTAHDAGAWVIEQIEGVWQFVVEVAGEVWRFVLDTMASIGQACMTLLRKMKAGWDAVTKFFKYLFNIEELRKTAHGIKRLINGTLDLAAVKVFETATKVDDGLKAFEKNLGEALGLKLPPGLGDAKDVPKSDEKKSGVEANVGIYHMEQAAQGRKEPFETTEKVPNVFDELMMPALKRAGGDVEDAIGTVVEFVKTHHGITANQLREELLPKIGGQLLDLGMSLIRAMTSGFFALGQEAIIGLKKILNLDLGAFGIFGGLIGTVNFGLVDVVGWVLAFVVNALSGLTSGSPPVAIQNIDMNETIRTGVIQPGVRAAAKELAGYAKIVANVIQTLRAVYAVATSSQAPEPESVTGFGVILDVLILIGTRPNADDTGLAFR